MFVLSFNVLQCIFAKNLVGESDWISFRTFTNCFMRYEGFQRNLINGIKFKPKFLKTVRKLRKPETDLY